MAEMDKTRELSRPWWVPWAFFAVAATNILTIAATPYDIL